MFGLEGDKKKNFSPSEDVGLELDIKDLAKRRALGEKIQKRIFKLKEILNAGVEQEEINVIFTLMQGYSSFFKIINRKPKQNFK